MKNLIPLFLLLPLLFTGCQEPALEAGELSLLNVDELVADQFAYLSEHPPLRVEKLLLMEDQEEVQTADTTELQTVARLLKEIDLNRPAYVNSYEIDTIPGDINVVEYRAREEENIAVRQVRYFYRTGGAGKVPVALLVIKRSSNPLYQSLQLIDVRFEDGLLQRAEVEGWQDVIFMEPSRYRVAYRIVQSE